MARPLDEVDATLHGLVLLLAAITAGGVVLAAVLGHFVSRASLAPIRRFTERTEQIASAPELVGRRLPVERDDELGRAGAFLQHDARRARSAPSTPSGSSSPTPPTSCARRSPR